MPFRLTNFEIVCIEEPFHSIAIWSVASTIPTSIFLGLASKHHVTSNRLIKKLSLIIIELQLRNKKRQTDVLAKDNFVMHNYSHNYNFQAIICFILIFILKFCFNSNYILAVSAKKALFVRSHHAGSFDAYVMTFNITRRTIDNSHFMPVKKSFSLRHTVEFALFWPVGVRSPTETFSFNRQDINQTQVVKCNQNSIHFQFARFIVFQFEYCTQF